MSTIAIGDIHGKLAPLRDLLSKIKRFLTKDTTVVFLGDYIDGGPDSKGVIDELLRFRSEHPGNIHFLKGNHEQWLQKSFDKLVCFSTKKETPKFCSFHRALAVSRRRSQPFSYTDRSASSRRQNIYSLLSNNYSFLGMLSLLSTI